MKQYYFNGGMYLKNASRQEYEFDAVRPTNGLPYVTEDLNGIRCTSHHSSIYSISEDFKIATCIKDNKTVPSPKKVELSEKLQKEFATIIHQIQQILETEEFSR